MKKRGTEKTVGRNPHGRHEPGRFLRWLRKGPRGLRLLRLGGIIVMLIIALTAILSVLPSIPPFKQAILSLVDRKTSSLLSCRVTIGTITLDLWNGVVAKNVVLSDSHSIGAPLSLERIAARIDPMALLRGRFELRSIKFRGFSGEIINARRGLFLGPVDIGRMMAPIPKNPKMAVGKTKPLVRMLGAERCTISFVDSVRKISASGTITSFHMKFMKADSLSFVMRTGAGHFSSNVWSGRFRSIDTHGTLGPASVRFDGAEVRGDSVLLSLSGIIPLSMEKTWNLTVNAEAFVAGLTHAIINVGPLKSVGKIKAKADMTGSIGRPVLNVTMTGYGLQAGPVAADSLFLQAHYADNRLHGKARLWSPAGNADASVRAEITRLLLSPAVGRYAVTASARNMDMGHFISTTPRQKDRRMFVCDAGFYAAGSGFRRLHDTLSADIRKPADTTMAGPVDVAVRLADDRWDLTAAMKPGCEINGNGRYDARGAIFGSFHVRADSVERILSFFSKEKVRGSIAADALLSGTLSNPVISATVQSNLLHWRDVQVSMLWGRLTLRNRQLSIDTSHIAANGPIAGVLKGFVPGEFDGKVRVQAGVSGPLDSLRVGGDFQTGGCSYGRYQADTVFTRFRYADQSLQWQSLTFKRGKSVLTGKGTVSWASHNVSVETDNQLTFDNHPAGTISAKARFINHSVDGSVTTEKLDPVVVSPWFPRAQRFRGSLGVRGTVAGTSENPELRLNFSFDRAVSSGPVITVAGDLAFTNRIATVTMSTDPKGSGTPLKVTAHLPVAFHELSKGVGALNDGAIVSVTGDSVAYGSLINAFAPSVQSSGTISIHGRLSKANGGWGISCSTRVVNHGLTVKRDRIKAGRGVFNLRIDGPLDRPAARFTLSGDSIRYRGNLIAAYSGSGSIVDEILKLDSLHLTCKGGGADLSALVPVTLKDGFSINRNSRLSATFTAMPFSVVQPLMPDPVTVNNGVISGRVVIETTAKGVRQATGTLSLRDGECTLYECEEPLSALFADIDFNNESIILRRFQAECGGGRISGSGRAELGAKGVSAAQCVMRLNDVHLGGCTENLDLGVQTAEFSLTKDSSVAITVNAMLADTRFTQDFSLIDIGERINQKTPLTLRPPNSLFNKVSMRIAVKLNSNLTFESNLGNMLVDGTVTVTGRPDKPAIAGQLQILNGFVYYLDRKFTITQGTIRQYDPQRIDPSLDITATSGVSWYPPQGGKEDYDITLLIKGDLSHPIITLSADPSLPQQQIISLMTFGTVQMGAGTDLGPRTGSLVSQQLAGFGTRKLARFLNVESVGIYGNVFGPSSDGPQLSVTKQVSSRIVVTYKTGLSTLSQQMIQVSYRLLPFLYFEAESDQQAQGGIDLKFRYSH
jgi:autotransporter translocation and assembly factor TamB